MYTITQRDMITCLFIKAMGKLAETTECLNENANLAITNIYSNDNNFIITLYNNNPCPFEYKSIKINLDYGNNKYTADNIYIDENYKEQIEYIEEDEIVTIIHRIPFLNTSGFFDNLKEYLIKN